MEQDGNNYMDYAEYRKRAEAIVGHRATNLVAALREALERSRQEAQISPYGRYGRRGAWIRADRGKIHFIEDTTYHGDPHYQRDEMTFSRARWEQQGWELLGTVEDLAKLVDEHGIYEAGLIIIEERYGKGPGPGRPSLPAGQKGRRVYVPFTDEEWDVVQGLSSEERRQRLLGVS